MTSVPGLPGVAVSLPATAGAVGTATRWATRAQELGFAAVSAPDGLRYDFGDPLLMLAAVSAVTSTIGLITSVLIPGLHQNPVRLGKQLATLDRLSSGRLTVGMGIGSREDDYEAGGAAYRGRGRALDQQLALMRQLWAVQDERAGPVVGPAPVQPGGPRLAFAGMSAVSVRRVASLGAGWIAPPSPVAAFTAGRRRLHDAWQAAGRANSPHTIAYLYTAVGDQAETEAEEYFTRVYRWAPPVATMMRLTAAVGDDKVSQRIAAYREAGADVVLCVPCGDSIGYVDLLARAAERAAGSRLLAAAPSRSRA